MSVFAMPSSTLKDQDKIAWGWVECTNPKEITSDHIFTAYRIKQNVCKNKTCRRNCRGNPFCLSGLGEARLVEKLNSPPEDTNSTLQRRAIGNFVGLKNLGATCYVNSLLQLWFHNKAFRDAIFAWNPLEDPDEQLNPSLHTDESFLPKTVVGHLQQLFALMDYSKCRYIDPSPLVESLGLDTSTQQDAQEFSKLFISLLEKALKHQSLPHVQNLISDNFRGEYMYVTRCCKCLTESVSPSMFYELDLNVKGHSTLNECLAEFLQEEKLEGADCYSCAVCQTKQEACRFIKLCSLPPVLNLQLLRFVYDREKGQKKKLKTVIQFPETLDMTEFVGGNSEESLLYNLSAVLIHKGTRASSGHFVAYIKDGPTGTWNTFNDESVEKLEGKKLKLDEDDPENIKKPKVTRLPKGCQSSTDAYMLVYTSNNHKTKETKVQLSERLQNYVDSKNRVFDEFCEEIVINQKQGLEKQEQLLKDYNRLSVATSDDLDDIDVMATDWLVSWLDSKTDVLRQIDNSRLVCPHDRLDPCAVTSAKYVSADVAKNLYDQYGGGPWLKMSDALCRDCVTNTCSVLQIKTKTLEESKEVTNLLKKRMGVNELGYYVHKYCLKTWRTKVLNMVEGKNNQSKTNNRVYSSVNGDASEPITEETLTPSQNTPLSQNTTPSQSTPPHQTTTAPVSEPEDGLEERTTTEGRITPRRKKLQKKKFFDALHRRKNPTINVPLSEIRHCVVMCHRLQVRLNNTNNSNEHKECSLKQCKKLEVRLRRLTISPKSLKFLRQNHVEKNKDDKSVSASNYQSSEGKSEFETNGVHCLPCGNGEHFAVKHEDEEGNKTDDEMMDPTKEFNEAIMCSHGNLTIEESVRKLVPVRVWEILKQYFPFAPAFSSDAKPCYQCQNLASKDEVVKQQYYDSAITQKRELSDLYHLRNRPILGKTEDTVYILHKQYFHLPWCAFLKSSTRRDGAALVEPPMSLKVDMLLCYHGGLHYSPQFEEDMSRMVLVTRQEWEVLTNMYPTNREVTVAPDLTTFPELCQECFLARIDSEQKEKLNYERARLNIRLVPSAVSQDDTESSDTGSAKKRLKIDGSTSPVPPEYKKVMKNLPVVTGDVRRSARNRKVPGQKEVQFKVASTLTLRELKQKITSQLAVAPFDQHLSTLDGKELHGDYNTLSYFGILPNTTLLLQVDEPKESFEDDILEGCSTPTEPEAGFKGTGLLQAY